MRQRSLLVTGGSGYLGQHLVPKAAELFDLYTTYYRGTDQIKAGRPVELNLANRHEVFRVVAEVQPQAIIHAAAINPGKGDQQAMQSINGQGTRYIAEAAGAVGARLVVVSTDNVHSGHNAPYEDETDPSPINDYGTSKAAGEAAVLEIDPGAAIVRTSLIYGLQVMDRGTAGFVTRLQQGEPLILFNDVIRQPIWVETLVEALLRLVDIEFGGRLNVVGRQAMTREAFGRRMLDWWGLETGTLLGTGRASDISDSIPLDLRMTVAKAEQLLQMEFPGVDEVLAEARGV